MNLLRLFGPRVLDSKVYRIDFTVDIFKEYEDVHRGLDVKYKRANVEFLGGSIRTGVLIGTGNDKISIYNKAKKENVKKPWTRIERQLSSSKLIKEKIGISKLGDLRYKLPKILDFSPLSIVTLNHLDFVEPVSPTTDQLERFNELKALIKHEGLFLTRKKLTKNRNFGRDYGKFFVLTPYQTQPEDIFNRDVIKHFQEVLQ